jgi:hypothetical protein
VAPPPSILELLAKYVISNAKPAPSSMFYVVDVRLTQADLIELRNAIKPDPTGMASSWVYATNPFIPLPDVMPPVKPKPTVECPTCSGRGSIEDMLTDGKFKCVKCKGEGRIAA